jgi:hypothetical protein
MARFHNPHQLDLWLCLSRALPDHGDWGLSVHNGVLPCGLVCAFVPIHQEKLPMKDGPSSLAWGAIHYQICILGEIHWQAAGNPVIAQGPGLHSLILVFRKTF